MPNSSTYSYKICHDDILTHQVTPLSHTMGQIWGGGIVGDMWICPIMRAFLD